MCKGSMEVPIDNRGLRNQGPSLWGVVELSRNNEESIVSNDVLISVIEPRDNRRYFFEDYTNSDINTDDTAVHMEMVDTDKE